tara:strand:+ start:127 stop:516 length:390 start_codon:yes stop_codon:yes gene_type:complete
MAEKRKPITLKKTRGGAYQYGGENARKFEDLLFKNFLNDSSSDPNIMEKMDRLGAAHYADRDYDERGRIEKQMMMFAKEEANERRKKPKAKKPKKRPTPFKDGGVVKGRKKPKMGCVMKGRGGKYKGQS